jgi:hypothetical protein
MQNISILEAGVINNSYNKLYKLVAAPLLIYGNDI